MRKEDLNVEVFRTNVEGAALAQNLTLELTRHLGSCRVTFDLDDHDRVLRVEGTGFNVDEIIRFLHEKGQYAEPLD